MEPIKIAIRSISDNPRFVMPSQATAGSHGFDICAFVKKAIAIQPGKIAIVPTDVTLQMPSNVEAQVRSRSGLAAKNGVFVLNSPGTIDSDYTGEVKVILANFGADVFFVQPGMRIAQIVFATVPAIELVNTSTGDLFTTDRGAGGFGSTGV